MTCQAQEKTTPPTVETNSSVAPTEPAKLKWFLKIAEDIPDENDDISKWSSNKASITGNKFKTTWAGIRSEYRKCLSERDYERLDALAEFYRTTNAHVEHGESSFKRFYECIGSECRIKYKTRTKDYMAIMEKWEKSTGSPTATIAKAYVQTIWAWEAKMSDLELEVRENLFVDRLWQAEEMLSINEEFKNYPYYYDLRLHIATGVGMNQKKYFELLDEAVSKHPYYHDYHYQTLFYLMPRWHGRSGDMAEYADKVFHNTDENQQYQLYARMALSLKYAYGLGVFEDTGLSWDKTKEGFLRILKETNNDQYNYASLGYYACLAGDKETAKNLFLHGPTEYMHNTFALFNAANKSFEKWVIWSGLSMADLPLYESEKSDYEGSEHSRQKLATWLVGTEWAVKTDIDSGAGRSRHVRRFYPDGVMQFQFKALEWDKSIRVVKNRYRILSENSIEFGAHNYKVVFDERFETFTGESADKTRTCKGTFIRRFE